jgi:CRP-like cAMP-binding protein
MIDAPPSSCVVSSSWSDEPERSVDHPLVRKLQGLANLTATDVAALQAISSSARMFGPHADLIREGEVLGDELIILEGIACRYKQRRTGARQIIAYVLPGDLCGADVPYMSRMDHAVGTLSTCLVARIPHQAWTALLARHPKVAFGLRLSKQAEEATAREWIMNLGCRSATERMAHLFCELVVRLAAVGLVQQGSYALPLTQLDLAETLGLSNVHVNRVLKELRQQGLVAFDGKRLTLLKHQRLIDIAEFSSNYLRPVPVPTGMRASE